MARIEMGGDTQLATLWQPGLSAIVARSLVLKSNNYQLLTVTALELETKVREDFTITKKLISNENKTQMIITDGQH